jgi:hypothetical protein
MPLAPSFARFLLSVMILFTAGWGIPQEVGKTPSTLREYAYGKSGEWLYEGLAQARLPSSRPATLGEKPFDLPVDWDLQKKEKLPGFPLTELCVVEFKSGKKKASALWAGFGLKWCQDGQRLFDGFYRGVAESPRFSSRQKEVFKEKENEMRERAMVFYLAFSAKEARVVYYPGRISFRGGERDHQKGWIAGTPKEIQEGRRSDHALIQDSHGLLALFNGTFDRSDNFVAWRPQPESIRYGGFGFDGKTYEAPQPSMATFALYRDGTFRLGTYRHLPKKSDIRVFVQNRFMVLERGSLGKDARPDAFKAFHDDIARAYLFVDGKGRFGYLWTLYVPPEVLAPLALKMGIRDLMLLDIHAPISCSIADPVGPLVFSSWDDYQRRSFDLVPNFFRLSPMKRVTTWVAQALESRIQTPYAQEAFRYGCEDYFAVFLAGSPETVRKARP